jgi:hypothetical protein
VDLPPVVAPLEVGLAATVRPVAAVTGFYAGGSLGTGDFRLGVSDLDLVALVEAPLTTAQTTLLTSVHQGLTQSEPLAAKLHCAYVPVPDIVDLAAEHWTWAHGELYRRTFTGVARAELLTAGITVYGPRPAHLLPPVSRAELAVAALAELSGYWTGAVAMRRLWLQDVYVDLGLLTLPRVEAVLTEGRLITKAEALPRLAGFGVSPDLAQEIGRRRDGEPVTLSVQARIGRAQHARQVMAAGIARLLADRT